MEEDRERYGDSINPTPEQATSSLRALEKEYDVLDKEIIKAEQLLTDDVDDDYTKIYNALCDKQEQVEKEIKYILENYVTLEDNE
jgi:hypothetical protein